jgi:hypothetical protein
LKDHWRYIPVDKLIGGAFALWVPSLFLAQGIYDSPWSGGAAITSTLANLLGRHHGMIKGILFLEIFALLSYWLSQLAIEKAALVFLAVRRRKGHAREDVLRELAGYPISRGMKLKIIDALEKTWPMPA